MYFIPKTLDNISSYHKQITIPECKEFNYSFTNEREITIIVYDSNGLPLKDAKIDLEKITMFSNIQVFPESGKTDENGRLKLLTDKYYYFYHLRILPPDSYGGPGKVTSLFIDNNDTTFEIKLDKFYLKNSRLLNDRGEYISNASVELVDKISNLPIYKTITDKQGNFTIPLFK